MDDVRIGKPGLHRGLIGSGAVDADGFTEKTPVWETHESTTEALSTSEGTEIIWIFQWFQRFSAFQWFLGRHSSCSANQGPPSNALLLCLRELPEERFDAFLSPALLHGGESQINNGAMRHRAVHHRPAADLVAGKPFLAMRAPRAGALVKIEVDLSTGFLEVDSRNDIPLEGHQSLDISDFHTRSRQSGQGDVTSKMSGNRHALTTESRFFPLRTDAGIPARFTGPSRMVFSISRATWETWARGSIITARISDDAGQNDKRPDRIAGAAARSSRLHFHPIRCPCLRLSSCRVARY
jgi:hypothetical protein